MNNLLDWVELEDITEQSKAVMDYWLQVGSPVQLIQAVIRCVRTQNQLHDCIFGLLRKWRETKF